MTRAMASVPPVRLPMENPPEGYWEERDLGVCERERERERVSDAEMEEERGRQGGRGIDRERDRWDNTYDNDMKKRDGVRDR